MEGALLAQWNVLSSQVWREPVSSEAKKVSFMVAIIYWGFSLPVFAPTIL